MESLSFQARDFEGPLDLLLALIAKHRLDLRELPLMDIIQQYLDAVASWQQENLDVASSFLEMASRLVHMKTVLLLPRHEEQAEKLKAELQGQLIEYSLCKIAAGLLSQKKLELPLYPRDPIPFEGDPTYTLHHFRGLLFDAYQDAIGRGKRKLPPEPAAFAPLVTKPVVSVQSRITSLLAVLYRSPRVSFQALFDGACNKSELVATFLAVLELLRDNRILMRNEQVCLNKNAASEHSASNDWE